MPILFVGAGPGAEDLITVRGMRALEQADLVIYAGSLINPALLKYCRSECVCLDSASLNLEEQLRLMSEATQAGKKVVRLHSGDPTLYGGISEQIRGLAVRGIESTIVPGVSSLFAASASLGCELTAPGISQSVVLTRTPGRTPMPEREKASVFARTGATLVFFLSADKLEALTQELMHEGGLAPDTPSAVVWRASWPEEKVLRTTLGNLAQQAEQANIGLRQALILVGKGLQFTEKEQESKTGESHVKNAGTNSCLYDAAFSHGYRNDLPEERFQGRCALFFFTEQGNIQAQQLAHALGNVTLFDQQNHKQQNQDREKNDKSGYASKGSSEFQEENSLLLANSNLEKESFFQRVSRVWDQYDAHIFIGAAGIAVRAIAPLLRGKISDPAVVVCTENGSHVISLVSGHLGGANRLARRIARITGGQAVISTSSDLRHFPAFDEIAAQENAVILNPEKIKILNAAVIRGEKLAFCGSRQIFDRSFAPFADQLQIRFVDKNDFPEKYAVFWDTTCAIANPKNAFVNLTNTIANSENTKNAFANSEKKENSEKSFSEILYITSKAFAMGIGCNKGIAFAQLRLNAEQFLREHHIDKKQLAYLATCDLKAEEKALIDLAQLWHLPVKTYDVARLNAVPVPTPSEKVQEKIGTASVCEAACLLAAGGETTRLYAQKHVFENSTFALAKLPHGTTFAQIPEKDPLAKNEVKATLGKSEGIPESTNCESFSAERGSVNVGSIRVLGLGSGNADQITPEVSYALRTCQTVAGYTQYLNFIRDRLIGKKVLENGMHGERARCQAALEAALYGESVAMVCSGDPGILAMAGLLYELRAQEKRFASIPIKVLPGITAASLAGSLLGAPLQNGVILLSLSDLLLPKEEILRNVHSAAKSALPVALYNPAGHHRRALLHEALQIFLQERGKTRLCAFVRNAGRPDSDQWIGTLAEFPEDQVDMSTVVLICGDHTQFDGEALYETRGYNE